MLSCKYLTSYTKLLRADRLLANWIKGYCTEVISSFQYCRTIINVSEVQCLCEYLFNHIRATSNKKVHLNTRQLHICYNWCIGNYTFWCSFAMLFTMLCSVFKLGGVSLSENLNRVVVLSQNLPFLNLGYIKEFSTISPSRCNVYAFWFKATY